MKSIKSYHQIPNGSLLYSDTIKWDYIDSYVINKSTSISIDNITTKAFQSPRWVEILMQLRNFIVKSFGLKTEGISKHTADYYPIGAKAMIFTVTARNQNEIVVSEDDKHLLFKVSVLNNIDISEISITTVVKYHNTLGKVYFFFVKPFHRFIVWSLAKKLSQNI